MPYKRKGSPYWWVNLKGPNGQRIRQSTGTANKQEAEAIEGRLKAELWQQQTWGKAPEYTFEEVMTEYLKAKKGSKSFRNIQTSIEILRHYFGGVIINTVKKEYVRSAIQRMQRERGYTASSLSIRMSYFKAAIAYCRKELDWNINDPSEGISLPKRGQRVRWLTREEADRLINAANGMKCHDLLCSFIVLALNTGMRKNEMLKLQWRSVNFEERIVTLLADENKSGRTRSVPLNAAAIQVLEKRRAFAVEHGLKLRWVFAKEDGERWAYPDPSFRKACRLAGIEDFRVHDLRHTCASWMVSHGVPLADVKEVLGHFSVTMTERYAHLAPHRAMQAVSVLS